MRNGILVTAICFCLCGCQVKMPKADISAMELYHQHQEPGGADVKYEDKDLSVSGVIESVAYSWLTPYGYMSVFLGEADQLVFCNFPPETANQTSKLIKAVVAVIRGVCKGAAFDRFPFLADCTIVR